MSEPLVTAVIPTKDRAALCVRAVESVLAQTWCNIECIVVDDGSADGTSAILSERFGDRIRVVRNEVNQGVALARNRAIGLARGTYLAFLDSDDEWLPEKTARQVELAERGAGVVYCRAVNVTPDGNVLSIQPARHRGDLSRTLLLDDVIGSPSKVLLRRSCLDGLPLFQPGIHTEDWELWIRLSFRTRFDFVPEVLVRMQFDLGSRHWTAPAEQCIASDRAIYAGLESDPLVRDAVRAFRRRIESTIDYRGAGHQHMEGDRRAALRSLLRSVRRDPRRLRAWKLLAVVAAGGRFTAAARKLRSWVLSRRG